MKYKHYFSGGAVLLGSLIIAALSASTTFSQAATCTGYGVSTDKASYNYGEFVKLNYSCNSSAGGTVETLSFEIVSPDGERDAGTAISGTASSGQVSQELREDLPYGVKTTYYDKVGTYTMNLCIGTCGEGGTAGPKFGATFTLAALEGAAAMSCPGGFTATGPNQCAYSSNLVPATCPANASKLHLGYGSSGGPQYWDCKASQDANTITCSSRYDPNIHYYVSVSKTCDTGDSAIVCPNGYSALGQTCQGSVRSLDGANATTGVTCKNSAGSIYYSALSTGCTVAGYSVYACPSGYTASGSTCALSSSSDSSSQPTSTTTTTTPATYKTCDPTSKTLTTCAIATYDKSKTGFSCYKITSASFETLVLNACKSYKGGSTSTGSTGTTPPPDTTATVTPPPDTTATVTPPPDGNTADRIIPPTVTDLPSDSQGLNTYLRERKGDLLNIARFFSQEANTKEAKEVQKLVRDNAKEIAQIEILLKNSKNSTDLMAAQKKLEEVEKKLAKLEDRKSEIVVGQQCTGVNEKITSLEEVLNKLKKAGAKKVAAEVQLLEEDIKNLKTNTGEACKAKDEFSLVALTPDLDAIEQSLQEKATVVVQAKADEYVDGTTNSLRKLADEAEGAIEDIAICRRVAPMIAKVRNLAEELEKAAKKSDTASIGKLVSEAKNTQEILGTGVLRCANERLETLDELSANTGTAVAVNLNDKEVASLNGVPAEAWLDSKMPGILSKIAEFTNISRDAPIRGINGLMALDSKSRNKILKSKEIFLKRALEIDAVTEELDAAPETKGKLLQMASGLATTTFCGDVAKRLQQDMEKLTDALKEHTINEAEILTAVANFQTQTAKNQEACYRDKIVKFVDAAPEQWYFRFVSKWLEGKDGVSRPNENVRIVEILPPVLKALGENVTGQNCTIDQPISGVPSWGSCWVKQALKVGLKPSAKLSFSDFATREQVADFVNQLAGEQLPVQGISNDIKIFKDIEICGDKKNAVSMMKANGIMTGLGAEGKNLWGCGKLLTRAELAAVIDRVNGVLFVPSEAVLIPAGESRDNE